MSTHPSILDPTAATATTTILSRRVVVDGRTLFYREAGSRDKPTLLLLHGFPSSSHMFRDLMADLAGRYHLLAPDLPGFGFSDAPPTSEFVYTFDHLAEVIGKFTDALELARYALYVFDYGAPVGWRLAAARPERISALISQNGNAYEEGLSDGWNPIRAYWQEPSAVNREALRALLTPETTRWQYTHGVPDELLVAPESYTLDSALLARPGNDTIQLDLFLDYRHNVALYPKFQEYFRTHRPPLLAVWGKNDPFFLPAGAEAFRRDLPEAEVKFYDTGHFALETHHARIAADVDAFLTRTLARGRPSFDLDPSPSTMSKSMTTPAFPAAPDSPAAAAALDRAAAHFGFVPNLARIIAHSPPVLDAYLAGLDTLAHSSLSPAEQELALVVTGVENDCAYSVAVHSALARAAGLPESALAAARAGQPIVDEWRLEALRRFTQEAVANRGHLPGAEVEAFLNAGFSRQQLVEVLFGVGVKTFVHLLQNIADVPLDEPLAAARWTRAV